MANKKITDATTATSVAGTDKVFLNQGGDLKQVDLNSAVANSQAVQTLNSNLMNTSYISPLIKTKKKSWCEFLTFETTSWSVVSFMLFTTSGIYNVFTGYDATENSYLPRSSARNLITGNKDQNIGFKVINSVLHIYIKSIRDYISIMCTGLSTEKTIPVFDFKETDFVDSDMDKIF